MGKEWDGMRRICQMRLGVLVSWRLRRCERRVVCDNDHDMVPEKPSGVGLFILDIIKVLSMVGTYGWYCTLPVSVIPC